MRRRDDDQALHDINDARQIVWSVSAALRGGKSSWAVIEYVRDLEAADARLTSAASALSRPRAMFPDKGLIMSDVPEDSVAVSAAQADAMSRIWQLVGTIQTMRTDITAHVRRTEGRDRTLAALDTTLTQLVLAAGVLMPPGLLQFVQERHIVHVSQDEAQQRG